MKDFQKANTGNWAILRRDLWPAQEEALGRLRRVGDVESSASKSFPVGPPPVGKALGFCSGGRGPAGQALLLYCFSPFSTQVNYRKKEGAMDKLSIYIPQQYRSKKPLERLHKVAQKRDRSMNYLAIQAIIEYLEREERRDLIERK
jgi:hypothetical protein